MTDNIVVFSYLLITLGIGVWVGRKVGSTQDYATGGRRYPAWIIFIALSASFIGGGFTLGLAEKTFIYGFSFIAAIWGFSFKEILIALFIAPRINTFDKVITVGDIMEIAYGKRVKIVTGIASVLVCGGIIGAQVSACGSIIHAFLGPPPMIGTLLAGGIVIIYATIGGLRSVVVADILHFSVFAIILPLVLFFGIKEIGGIAPFIQAIPATHIAFSSIVSLKGFIILFISFFLGESLIPPYVQRLLIGKTMNDTKMGTLWSGIFSVIFFLIIGCIGLVALILSPGIPPASALPYTIHAAMPVGLKGLAIAAMLAVIMSSVDSFLNSIAIAFSNDILNPLGMIGKGKNQELTVYRTITLIIGTVSIIISISLSSSIDILLYSYQFWTPFILTPFIAAIFGVRSSEKIFFISAISGVSTVILYNIFEQCNAKSLIEGALEGTIAGVLVNTVVFLILHRYFNPSTLSKHKASF